QRQLSYFDLFVFPYAHDLSPRFPRVRLRRPPEPRCESSASLSAPSDSRSSLLERKRSAGGRILKFGSSRTRSCTLIASGRVHINQSGALMTTSFKSER